MNSRYLTFVKENSGRLGNLAKLASDLAAMLDDPLFQVTGGDSFSRQSAADRREPIFSAYCTVLAKAKVEIPVLEPELYLVHLTNQVDKRNQVKATDLQAFVRKQVKGKKTTVQTQCESILETVSLFPDVMGWGSISSKKIVCKLNQLLVEAGKDPIRPVYSESKLEGASDRTPPSRELKVLVVDDDSSEITKTMVALAGWGNITVKSFLHTHVRGDKTVIMTELARKIVAEKPDVVLMDEGLDSDINGSKLIPVIEAEQRNVDPIKQIVFVANTGGLDDDLCRAGAYENCEKGRKLQGVERAFAAASMTV